VLLLLVALASGCCGRSDVEIVRINGRVTLDGQPPPGPGTIYFAPTDAFNGEPLRPATGHFGSDGVYEVRSFDAGDGLVPGRYVVSIHCWQIPPTIDGPPAVSHIPARYTTAATSGLELIVESGARRVEWNAQLKSD
jgi:hypothetical protein